MSGQVRWPQQEDITWRLLNQEWLGRGQLCEVKTGDAPRRILCWTGAEECAPRGNENSEDDAESEEDVYKITTPEENRTQNAGCSNA